MEKDIKPKKIEKIEPDLLKIIWSDGLETKIELSILRDNCPCAQCTTGEKGKSRLAQFVENSLKEQRNKLMEIKTIGNYAILPVWGDGHDIGIYRWEHLREICVVNNIIKNL